MKKLFVAIGFIAVTFMSSCFVEARAGGHGRGHGHGHHRHHGAGAGVYVR